MNTEEYISILNADGSATGKTALKSNIHANGYYHDTAHVWFYTPQGLILLAQRAATKRIYPMLWDISVAGHVDAGETIEHAAIRETQEEIGLHITQADLFKIGVYECFQSYPNGIVDNEFHHTFIAIIDCKLTDFQIDTNEVNAIKFVSISDFVTLLKNSDANGHFVSSNTNYYLDVIKAIENKIVK